MVVGARRGCSRPPPAATRCWSGHLKQEPAGERGTGLPWLGAACPPLPFTSLAHVLRSQDFSGGHPGVLVPCTRPGAGVAHPCRVTAKAGSRSRSPSPRFLEGRVLQRTALHSRGLCLPDLEALVGVCVHTPPAAVPRGQVLGSPTGWPGQASSARLWFSCL